MVLSTVPVFRHRKGNTSEDHKLIENRHLFAADSFGDSTAETGNAVTLRWLTRSVLDHRPNAYNSDHARQPVH